MHAIVTGGSSGIGLATAHALARRGMTVSLIARREKLLAEAARELQAAGATVHTSSVDVADQAAVTAAISRLEETAGPSDVLVTSAGEARPGRFLELDDIVFRQMMEVDYFGTLHAIRAVAPGMAERRTGSIVAVSSAAGLAGIYGYTAYGAAKFAVRGLMEALRMELAPHGVHVACVFPPDVDTPQLAEENEFKPAETFAVSGAIKPISPERVAERIMRAIDRKRYAVYPTAEVATLAGIGPLIAPGLRRWMDRRVRRA